MTKDRSLVSLPLDKFQFEGGGKDWPDTYYADDTDLGDSEFIRLLVTDGFILDGSVFKFLEYGYLLNDTLAHFTFKAEKAEMEVYVSANTDYQWSEE